MHLITYDKPSRAATDQVTQRKISAKRLLPATGLQGMRGRRGAFGDFDHSGMGRKMGLGGAREFMDTHSVGFPA